MGGEISMRMILFILIEILIVVFSGYGWYRYFYGKEKRVLNDLQRMIDDVSKGQMNRNTISEEKLSAVENSLKRYLEDSLLENENQKQQKEIIQSLISDISHQTLTPISNLKIYTELLKEAEESNEIVDTIQEQTDKLDFLIQSLVKLSRLESGIIEVKAKTTPLQNLLKRLESRYTPPAKDKGIFFSIEDTILSAEFDLKWTEEALGNIVDNAIKYSDTGTCITVSVEEYSFFVRIDIKDEGMGIAEEEIPKIFSRFYRSHKVADLQGVGIGLYLAREIIKAENGYIKVKSKPDQGSVFSVFLPKSQ